MDTMMIMLMLLIIIIVTFVLVMTLNMYNQSKEKDDLVIYKLLSNKVNSDPVLSQHRAFSTIFD